MTDRMKKTTTQRKADIINSAYPLPVCCDNAYDLISGSEKKEYYTRSPWATITAYDRGFVVNNLVTGSHHPVATWKEAAELRSELKNRYIAISNF